MMEASWKTTWLSIFTAGALSSWALKTVKVTLPSAFFRMSVRPRGDAASLQKAKDGSVSQVYTEISSKGQKAWEARA